MTLYSHTEHIAVVGAGYAGLPCALKLASLAKKSDRYRVSLINRENRQELTCELYRSFRSGRAEFLDIKDLAERQGLSFLESSVGGIDPNNKKLYLKGSDKGEASTEIAYDHLILAMGTKAWVPPIEGLSDLMDREDPIGKRIFLFRNNNQAQSLRLALKRMKWEGPRFEDGKDRFVVILGAGLSGLEIAGEIAALRKRNHLARVVVVDAKPELLTDFSPVARKILKTQLHRMEIETILGSVAVKLSDRELHIANGQVIPWDLLVLCTGGRVHQKILEPFARQLDPVSGISVNGHFEIEDFPNHYAIGDIASVPKHSDRLSNKVSVEHRAQFAVQEAHYLARYLAKKISSGRSAMLPFEASDFGSLVSLGPYNGFARLGPEISGKFKKLLSPFIFGPAIDEMKRVANLKYLAQIHIDSRF